MILYVLTNQTVESKTLLAIQFQVGQGTVEAAQGVPVAPTSPLGIVKSKTAAFVVQLLVTEAFVQAVPVVVVQAVAVAEVQLSPLRSALVAFLVTGTQLKSTKGIRSVSNGTHVVSWDIFKSAI